MFSDCWEVPVMSSQDAPSGSYTRNFYTDLPAVKPFLAVVNPAVYADAPGDWYVMVTDVTNSTEAIASGRYREVNLLGASSIIAVLNALRPLEVPFVFGGDGASFLIPPDAFAATRDALLGVRDLAEQRFGLDLRVGSVPVSAVQAAMPLRVARLQVSDAHFQASFLGGGISYAAELVKADGTYRLDGLPQMAGADLRGLECRWQEVPSRHGHTLSLLIAAMPSSQIPEEKIYRDVLQTIQRIYGTMERYHPIAPEVLRLAFHPKKLMAEVKARSPSSRFLGKVGYCLRLMAENLLGIVFMGLRLTVGGVNWGRYKQEVCAASDYQKIDDILRMVISGTPTQTEALRAYLEQEYQAGRLAYGMHVSDRALLTCLIVDRRQHHLHLVDGADGGYTLAAKELKTRLNRKVNNWNSYTRLLRKRQEHRPS